MRICLDPNLTGGYNIKIEVDPHGAVCRQYAKEKYSIYCIILSSTTKVTNVKNVHVNSNFCVEKKIMF